MNKTSGDTIRNLSTKYDNHLRASGEASAEARTCADAQREYEALQSSESQLLTMKCTWDQTSAELEATSEARASLVRDLLSLAEAATLVLEVDGQPEARAILAADTRDPVSIAARLAERLRKNRGYGPELATHLEKLAGRVKTTEAKKQKLEVAFDGQTHALLIAMVKASALVKETNVLLNALGVKKPKKKTTRSKKELPAVESATISPISPDAYIQHVVVHPGAAT
jgi:hypothetical protein